MKNLISKLRTNRQELITTLGSGGKYGTTNVKCEKLILEEIDKTLDEMDNMLSDSSVGMLHKFFNSKSDANKFLTAEQQEELENDFDQWLFNN